MNTQKRSKRYPKPNATLGPPAAALVSSCVAALKYRRPRDPSGAEKRQTKTTSRLSRCAGEVVELKAVSQAVRLAGPFPSPGGVTVRLTSSKGKYGSWHQYHCGKPDVPFVLVVLVVVR